jgi:hypothetical protein
MLSTSDQEYLAHAEQSSPTASERPRAERKLSACIRFARECSQNFRETGNAEFRRLRKEAMTDARYWWIRLKKAEPAGIERGLLAPKLCA